MYVKLNYYNSIILKISNMKVYHLRMCFDFPEVTYGCVCKQPHPSPMDTCKKCLNRNDDRKNALCYKDTTTQSRLHKPAGMVKEELCSREAQGTGGPSSGQQPTLPCPHGCLKAEEHARFGVRWGGKIGGQRGAGWWATRLCAEISASALTSGTLLLSAFPYVLHHYGTTLKESPKCVFTNHVRADRRKCILTCQKERWLSELEYVARYRPSGAKATAVIGPLWPWIVWQEGERTGT